MAIMLSFMYSDVRCHIVHLSAASALPLIREIKSKGLPLSVETCPHYLTLQAEDIPDKETQFKCCPPIRDSNNQVRNLPSGEKLFLKNWCNSSIIASVGSTMASIEGWRYWHDCLWSFPMYGRSQATWLHGFHVSMGRNFFRSVWLAQYLWSYLLMKPIVKFFAKHFLFIHRAAGNLDRSKESRILYCWRFKIHEPRPCEAGWIEQIQRTDQRRLWWRFCHLGSWSRDIG